jgi:hypothetical protein
MLHIFQRQCNNINQKNRPDWFSHEFCFKNLLNTVKNEKVILNIIFDGEPSEKHFLNKYKEFYNLIKINGGSEGSSFDKMIDHITNLNLNDDDIIYILEDDYLHIENWITILNEGIKQINADYVTLYDHKDKYYFKIYDQIREKIFISNSVHWRTTPSTTSTFACKFKILKRDKEVHKNFAKNNIVDDHNKFLELWNRGSNLISCIPGYSTHVEQEYLSPLVNWKQINNKYINL